MPKPTRLNGFSSDIRLEFVKWEATSRGLIRLSTQLQLRGLSLADAVRVLEKFGVQRTRSTMHDWCKRSNDWEIATPSNVFFRRSNAMPNSLATA